MTITTEEGSLKSELAMYDAQTMSSQAVCRVRLPQTVPLGFHCSWVPEAEIGK